MNPEQQQTSTAPEKNKSFPVRRFLNWIFAGFFIWLLLRTFVFQIMYIPSASMQGTLFEGDRIIVNKMVYGARIPITPLSVPFTEKQIYLDWIELPYLRIPGYDRVHRNDVLVFNLPSENYLPVDQRKLFIKRCIGLPGDTLQIVNGNIVINGYGFIEKPTVLKRYQLELKDETNSDSLFKSLRISPPWKRTDQSHFIVSISEIQLKEIKASRKIISADLFVSEKKYFNPLLFPGGTDYKWNEDQFGPLVIPAKGKQTKLNSQNIVLYQSLIEAGGDSVFVKNGQVYINGKQCIAYTFKENCFFVLGDNRPVSEDSRYWGFLPESHLIGKASRVISSKEEGRGWHPIE